ncbi:hypothetical protein N7603_06860 [Acholeplasma vituli]|uniref:Uncharacterized protein n=1 Tax=Paracholeplasma vituli TaxID=69473 RepID=A0ABT2PWN3_9MOLU|nr:hypothetical protein [Paracholeplasma vituli]MCU0105373.1 hypothetical protein [Paracholeplasma vituli]
MAEYQGDLYHITVRLLDDTLVYDSTLIEVDYQFASYTNTNQTSVVISQDNAVSIYNDAWISIHSFTLDGDFSCAIKSDYYGPYVIETPKHYYVLKDSILKMTLDKHPDITYLGAQLYLDWTREDFMYYFLENNQVKRIVIAL